MHLNDPLGDRQSQAGAALLAGDRIVGLLKLLKQLGLIGSGNAWSGATDGYTILFAVAQGGFVVSQPK